MTSSVRSSDPLKVVHMHEHDGHSACVITCAGINTATDFSVTDLEHNEYWNTKLEKGFVTAQIDISECGFVSTPLVTTTVEMIDEDNIGQYYNINALIAGAGSVTGTTATDFMVYLSGIFFKDVTLDAHTFETYWDLHWTATGYVC